MSSPRGRRRIRPAAVLTALSLVATAAAIAGHLASDLGYLLLPAADLTRFSPREAGALVSEPLTTAVAVLLIVALVSATGALLLGPLARGSGAGVRRVRAGLPAAAGLAVLVVAWGAWLGEGWRDLRLGGPAAERFFSATDAAPAERPWLDELYWPLDWPRALVGWRSAGPVSAVRLDPSGALCIEGQFRRAVPAAASAWAVLPKGRAENPGQIQSRLLDRVDDLALLPGGSVVLLAHLRFDPWRSRRLLFRHDPRTGFDRAFTRRVASILSRVRAMAASEGGRIFVSGPSGGTAGGSGETLLRVARDGRLDPGFEPVGLEGPARHLWSSGDGGVVVLSGDEGGRDGMELAAFGPRGQRRWTAALAPPGVPRAAQLGDGSWLVAFATALPSAALRRVVRSPEPEPVRFWRVAAEDGAIVPLALEPPASGTPVLVAPDRPAGSPDADGAFLVVSESVERLVPDDTSDTLRVTTRHSVHRYRGKGRLWKTILLPPRVTRALDVATLPNGDVLVAVETRGRGEVLRLPSTGGEAVPHESGQAAGIIRRIRVAAGGQVLLGRQVPGDSWEVTSAVLLPPGGQPKAAPPGGGREEPRALGERPSEVPLPRPPDNITFGHPLPLSGGGYLVRAIRHDLVRTAHLERFADDGARDDGFARRHRAALDRWGRSVARVQEHEDGSLLVWLATSVHGRADSLALFDADGAWRRSFRPPNGSIVRLRDVLRLQDGRLVLAGDFLFEDECYQVMRLAPDGAVEEYLFPLPKPWEGPACKPPA